MRPLTLSRWLLLSYGALSIAILGIPRFAGGSVGGALLLLAPLFAAAGCVVAVRALPPALGTPWVMIAGAAVSALAAQLAGGFADVLPHSQAAEAQALFFMVSLALLAVAVAWKLHQRDRERGVEIVLDTSLLVATATLVTLRWSPGARAVLENAGTVDAGTAIAVLGTPIAAGCGLLFAAVLAAVQRGHSARVAFAFLFAAAALGLAAAPISLGEPACCQPGQPHALAFALGWTGVAVAALLRAGTAPADFDAAFGEAGGRRLRLVVAPTVALVMGAVVVDAAWRAPIEDHTAITLGVAGVLLAMRVSLLLYATQQLSAERQELAQTKMLVDVGQALAGTTDLQTTLQVVTGWAKRMLKARAAAIELIDDSGEYLEFRSIDGLPLHLLNQRLHVAGSFSGSVVLLGRPRALLSAREEPGLSEESLAVLGRSPVAAAPLRYHEQTLGALTCIGAYPFTPKDLELLGALADHAAVAIENARLFTQVHTLSVTDPLTGLPNRRQLARDLAREFAAARRGRRLVAIMFDLNGFKEYNDRYGHLAGDEALKLFAAALATETRAMNLAARYGGDEFLALLADADQQGAEIFIERVSARFPGPNATSEQQLLSVAAGLAEYTPDMRTGEELVAAADRALYEVKSARKKQRA